MGWAHVMNCGPTIHSTGPTEYIRLFSSAFLGLSYLLWPLGTLNQAALYHRQLVVRSVNAPGLAHLFQSKAHSFLQGCVYMSGDHRLLHQLVHVEFLLQATCHLRSS